MIIDSDQYAGVFKSTTDNIISVKANDKSQPSKKEKASIVYIGNNLRIAEDINKLKDYRVVQIVCQSSKLDSRDREHVGSIPVKYVESKSDLIGVIKLIKNAVDFAVMYNFGIIVPQEVINLIKIYNFHPGNLRDNRGSSPVNWAILLNMKESTMSLHEVTADIDAGAMICEHVVPIYDYDTPNSLRYRLEGEIISMLLYLIGFRKNASIGKSIINGIYRPRISESDYTIHSNDTINIVNAKIQSQYDYNGAPFEINGTIHRLFSLQEYKDLI